MGSEQHVQLWDRCLTIIKDNINEEAFDSLFKPIVSLGFDDNVLTLLVPSHFVIEQIEEHYLSLLKKVLPRIYGASVKLLYRVQIVRQPEATVDLTATTKSTAVKKMQQSMPDLLDPFKQRVYDELDPRLNPIYTFESYYQGASNMLARTAAESIAANPGRNTFNPLFLFGESGVGKTHLIQAIGLRIKENNPASRVLYLSAHDFLVQYTDAVRNNRVNDFISFYQSIDVLLMDDIQEFAGKTQTQNTFFHIFNHLHQSNKQLVLTCDRPPVELVGMVSRLLTRFKWGLTAEVERPDYELRYDILMSKVRRDGLSISEEVIDYIARNVTDNVRDLEGVIVSLMVRSSVLKKEISIDMAVRNNRVNDFISFYQSIDVLLMDDIQEFAGKTQTQNTFFHIFNHLHQSNKQLVLTCDRPPVELVGMVSRLLTRFKWGLTAEVERPDYELRYDILMSKVRRDGLSISEEVIDYIARNVTDNVRDLEGVIVSLMVRSSVLKKEISIDMADQVLAASVKMTQKQITIDSIKEAVCGYYGLETSRLLERTRKREVVVARQLSMYLAKKYTTLSLAGIGDVLGKKDHATVLHACKTISEQVGVDKKLRSDLEEIEQRIQG